MSEIFMPRELRGGTSVWRDAQIVRAYRRGDKIRLIAEMCGVSIQRIQQIAKAAGCPPRNRRRGDHLTHFGNGDAK